MQLVILAGCRDERQLFRFPEDEGEFHGYQVTDVAEVGMESTILSYAAKKLRLSHHHLKLLTVVQPGLLSSSGARLPLAIVEVRSGLVAPQQWLTLPLIIRGMMKGPNRLVYGKAMQVFAGALSQETDALEIDDEVKARLQKLAEDDDL